MSRKRGVIRMMMIKKQTKFYKLLMGYWFLVPALFLAYTGLTCLKQAISFQELLTTTPTFSVGFLISCVMLVMGLMLVKVDKSNASRKSIFGKFILFSIVQQIMTFNIVGVILSGLTFYSLSHTSSENESLTLSTKIVMGLILVLSLLMGLISFNVFNK